MNDRLAADLEKATVNQGPGVIRSPWAILAVLTGLNLLNYVDRYVMAALVPKVCRKTSASPTRWPARS